MLFEGYLDAGGAMTTAFAVNKFNRLDAIWGTRSLYGRKADPALLLSQKFIVPADINSYNGVAHFNTVKRNTISETVIDTLPGWGIRTHDRGCNSGFGLAVLALIFMFRRNAVI